MPIDYERLMALEYEPKVHSYTERDTMLYALGLGVGSDPLDEHALRFVYEKELKALPTMATILGWDPHYLDAARLDRRLVVHGEQRLTLHEPVAVAGTIVSRRRIRDVFDKGADKGALVLVEQTIEDEASGERIATLLSTVFARGDGGFGGPDGSPPPLPQTPESEPEAVVEMRTLPQAALIYRLSGDVNPLHADPAYAAEAGFPRPILHGLCTYGIAGFAVLKTYCDCEPERLGRFDLRFSAPVFPGETIRTEMWRRDGRVHFLSRVLERDEIVLRNGIAEVED